MASTKIELQEQIKKLNHEHSLEFPVTDDYKDLQKTAKAQRLEIERLAEEKAAAAGTGDQSGNQNGDNKDAAKGKSANAVYVWLKNPAYADKDGKMRIGGGFYHVSLAEYPRLAKLPSTSCEIFEEVPTRKLTEIAQWFGINVEKHDDKELLEMLVKEPTLY